MRTSSLRAAFSFSSLATSSFLSGNRESLSLSLTTQREKGSGIGCLQTKIALSFPVFPLQQQGKGRNIGCLQKIDVIFRNLSLTKKRKE